MTTLTVTTGYEGGYPVEESCVVLGLRELFMTPRVILSPDITFRTSTPTWGFDGNLSTSDVSCVWPYGVSMKYPEP